MTLFSQPTTSKQRRTTTRHEAAKADHETETTQNPGTSPNSVQAAKKLRMVSEESEAEKIPDLSAELQKLDELISNPRWVIPVLPKGELEVLLEYSIKLTKSGVDKSCEPCQRFYREGLLISFTKIMTDEAVSSWRYDIQVIRYFRSGCLMGFRSRTSNLSQLFKLCPEMLPSGFEL